MRATVITDASFCPETKVAGWAGWIRIDGHPVPIKRMGKIKGPVNDATEAEVYAALNGIWVAVMSGATQVLIQSDCMSVINLVQRKALSVRLIKIWDEALARPEFATVGITAAHVKGHGLIKDARTFVNAWCDTNARAAIGKGKRKSNERRGPRKTHRQNGR